MALPACLRECLEDTLALSADRVRAMVVAAPTILMLNPDGVAAKVLHLSDLLALDLSAVSRLICTQPSVLTLSPGSMRDKFEALVALMGVSPEVASTLLVAVPALLTVSKDSLKHKLAYLTAMAALSPVWEEQLASASHKTRAKWLCFSTARWVRAGLLHQIKSNAGSSTYKS